MRRQIISDMLCGSGGRSRWRLVIQGFFDDSGKESNIGSPYVCMAGYIADENRWMVFSRLWRYQLLRHGIGMIHMRDLIPLQGQYKGLGWDTDKRNEVLGSFIKVIKETEIVGFGIGLDANYWRTIRPRLPDDGTAQTFCFARIMNMVINRMAKAMPKDFVAVTFDTDREFASARFNLFSDIWAKDERARDQLASIMFADPLWYPPLQAADLLAWETRKELMQKIGGYSSTPRWNDLFTQLSVVFPLRTIDYQSELWDAAEIEARVLSKLAPQSGSNEVE